MKIRNLYSTILAAALLLSCGSEQDFFPQVTQSNGDGAYLKFVHAASDTVGVNLLFNNVKITGNAPSTIVSTGAVNIGTVTYSNSFPVTDYSLSSSLSGDLTVVVPEVYTAADTFPTKTMVTVQPTFTASSQHTIAFVGIAPNYEAVVYDDDLSSTPIDGKAYIRFANFIHNSTDKLDLVGTPPVDADINPNPTPITLFEDIAYKDMTAFVALPQLGTYTNVRIVNSVTGIVVATLATNTSSFVGNKVYTVFARGRIGSGGTAAPTVSRMLNR